MLVTLLGMVTDCSDEQLSKVLYPMLVTLAGMVIDVKPLIPEQRASGIDCTLLPNVNLVILLKFWKGG